MISLQGHLKKKWDRKRAGLHHIPNPVLDLLDSQHYADKIVGADFSSATAGPSLLTGGDE